jgi:FKBP-type peptidyl-prolyl cis-trans isomerase
MNRRAAIIHVFRDNLKGAVQNMTRLIASGILSALVLSIVWGCETAEKPKDSRPAVPVTSRPAADAPATTSAPVKLSGEPAEGAAASPEVKDVTELQITEVKEGTGAMAEPGKTVFVHYRGTLTNGKEFDSSLRHGKPIDFVLGARRVIPGWDQGIKGMKVGGKRKLVIPPQLAYGPDGAGDDIPPNATLVFEVELVDVK